ncbi:hypothetical protein [uncultured Jatrophihabitans sp.]|uniref:hypothetical protein n=1 Tax=uncultured Jatrophihabitans sp. TaxID=1610747 RepID=UPI0035C9E5E2
MSPTEEELRSALRAGEGDGVDADRLISNATAHRRQRRVRLLSGAAAAVVVAAGATSLALWQSAGSSTNRHAAGDGPNPSSALTSPSPPTARAGSPGRPACPAAEPSTARAGAAQPTTGPLFGAPVTSVVVCAYGALVPQPGSPATSTPQTRLVLTGAAAHLLVDSLEHAASIRPQTMCPMLRSVNARSLAIYGVQTDGSTLTPVTALIGAPACQTPVTNGIAVRYDWTPPKQLVPTLDKLLPNRGATPPTRTFPTATLPTATQPTATAHGSPIHS